MFDFLVVGGSMSALSTAFVLMKKNPKLSVAVVGNFQDKHSATKCAGAMINCYAEVPYDALNFEPMKKKFELAREANQKWPSYLEKINEYSKTKLTGLEGKTICLLSSKSTSIEVKTFDYILNTLGKENEGIKEVPPDTIKAIKPTDLGRTIRAMQVPDSKINPHLTLDCLMSALTNMGVKLIEARASEANCEFISGKIKSIKLDTGDNIEAKQFIFAHGFDQNKLISSVKKSKVLPVLANGGSALKLSVPNWVREKGGLGKDLLDLKDVIRMVDRGGACGVHIVPNGDGTFYLGASSAVWINSEFTPKLSAVQVLMNSAIDEISYELFHYDVQLIGNGFRPMSIDGFPLIGGTSVENLWINNGMKRDGFTSSWAVAEYLVEGILGNRKDWGLFSPERELLSYKTREQAVQAALEVYQGSFVQHYGIQMPLRILAERQRQMNEIENTYKRVKNRNFGIHPELLHIYADNQSFKIIEPYI